MTTPTGPTLTLATDKDVYNPGDTLTLTATYSDGTSEQVELTINGTATDTSGGSATASISVQVNVSESQSMDVEATDSFGDTYAVTSNDGKGTAVLTTTVGTPPAQ